MPPKTIKKSLKDMLGRLSKADFDNFCDELVDRREEPRVSRNRVEGKSLLDIADVLVSTFTEAKAVEVAAELLREIDCNEDAERLVKEAGGLSSQPGPSGTAGPSAGAAGAAGAATMAQGGSTGDHFVDRYRAQLTERVHNIGTILDDLLEKKVIPLACYDEILAIPTTRDKMRKLYSGPLNAAGPAGKEIFYKILEKNEQYLIADLKEKSESCG